MSCNKYKHKASFQKDTWLKEIPEWIHWYHVIGNPDIDSPHIDETSRVLYVNTRDDYISLPHKVISSFQYVLQTFKQLKSVFKTDDDQILRVPSFFNKIRTHLQPHIHYGGYPVRIQTHISQYYMVHTELPRHLVLEKCIYCNGRFYLLSKHALEDVVFKMPLIKHRIIEDHAIGLYLSDSFKQNLLTFDTKQIFHDDT